MKRRIVAALRAIHGSRVAKQSQYTELGGHASSRIYWRISLPSQFPGPHSLIAMVLPDIRRPLTSEELGKPENEFTFVRVQKLLQSLDIRVPSISFCDPYGLKLLLLEDLGDTTFEDVVLHNPAERVNAYKEVISLLVRLQSRYEDTKPRGCWSRKSFDSDLLMAEFDHFTEWGFNTYIPNPPTYIYYGLTRAYIRITEQLISAPQTFVLRDYQSRNIMLTDLEWVLIDFQDALLGPFCYDLVALLRDSYLTLSKRELSTLIEYYHSQSLLYHLPWATLSLEQFTTLFHLQTLQRKLKDAGRFIYIRDVKNNPSFFPYFRPSLLYVKDALAALDDILFEPIDDAVDMILKKL